MPMPTFRKSPPELVARFGELAELAGDADRKQMFGYPVCVQLPAKKPKQKKG